jgi:hypothetical protein
MNGFPARYCRVVASRVHEDAAYVLLDTGSRGQSYLYGVNCVRRDGRWEEVASGNGPCWAQAGADPALGTLTLWGDAPPGADRVRAEFGGQVVDEPISGGVYLVAWWNVPADSWAHVGAFRIRGEWTRAAP